MPTSSQFKILHTIERLRSRRALFTPPLTPTNPESASPTPTFSFRNLNLSKFNALASVEELSGASTTAPDVLPQTGSVADVVSAVSTDATPDHETKGDEAVDDATASRRRAFSKVKSTDFATSKKMLYNLGFRGLPGDSRTDIDKSMMKKRPGLRSKSILEIPIDPNDDGITPEMNKGLNTEILIDFTCLDQDALRPTSVCFDAKPGIDITHAQLWKELQKVMATCPTLRILCMEFVYRGIKSDQSEDNRWIINTNSTYSRNILAGREIILGVSPRRMAFMLRRYDDMLLLEFKKNARATAWENVLGTKPKSTISLDDAAKPKKKKKKKKGKRKGKKSKSV